MKTIEQCKDAAAREFGYESFANANTWMHKHGQQFTEDPDNNIMFNIYNRAMALCIEGERQRILEALPTKEQTCAEFKQQGYIREFFEGMTTGADYMREKILKQLTNK